MRTQSDTIKIEKITNDIKSGGSVQGLLTLAVVSPKDGEKKNYILIDGQHRFKAMNKINPKYKFVIEAIVVRTIDEAKKEFVKLHKSTVLPAHEINQDLEVSEAVDRIALEYPEFFTKSTKPQRPYINPDQFKDQLSQAGLRKDLQTADEIQEALLKLNEKVCNEWSFSDIKRETETEVPDTIKKRCYSKSGKPFMLGMFRNDEWLDHLVAQDLALQEAARTEIM